MVTFVKGKAIISRIFVPDNQIKYIPGESFLIAEYRTVQTFNSCTSRPCVCQCPAVLTPIENTSIHKANASTTYVACKSKLRSVVRSSMHPCLGNWVAIGRAVVYYARAAHTLQEFNAGTVVECIATDCTLPRTSNDISGVSFSTLKTL